MGLAPLERVQHRTAEQIVGLPQDPGETFEAVTLAPHERVPQHTAEKIEDAPQSPAGVVEAVTLVPREQTQQRTAQKMAKYRKREAKTRVQRKVELAFGKLPFRSGFLRKCATKSAENVPLVVG